MSTYDCGACSTVETEPHSAHLADTATYTVSQKRPTLGLL